MFTSTKLIQDWLTDSARLVSMVCGQNMEWITPLGLPVVQPYSKIRPQSDNMKPFSSLEFHKYVELVDFRILTNPVKSFFEFTEFFYAYVTASRM